MSSNKTMMVAGAGIGIFALTAYAVHCHHEREKLKMALKWRSRVMKAFFTLLSGVLIVVVKGYLFGG